MRTNTNRLTRLAHETNEPIFLTRNGERNLVVMSLAHYNNIQHKFDVFSKLEVAERSRANGDKGKPLAQVTKELRKRLRATGKV